MYAKIVSLFKNRGLMDSSPRGSTTVPPDIGLRGKTTIPGGPTVTSKTKSFFLGMREGRGFSKLYSDFKDRGTITTITNHESQGEI